MLCCVGGVGGVGGVSGVGVVGVDGVVGVVGGGDLIIAEPNVRTPAPTESFPCLRIRFNGRIAEHDALSFVVSRMMGE